MQVVDLPDDVAVGEAVGTLEANPDVAYAEPNFEREAAAIPNDPEYAGALGAAEDGHARGLGSRDRQLRA